MSDDYGLHPRTARRLLVVVVVVGVAAAAAWRLGHLPAALGFGRNEVESRPVTPRGELAASERVTIDLFRRAAPAVVYITTTAVRRNSWTLDVFEIPRGTGTGFIWDDQGHIVTNFHLIQNASRARVTLADQRVFDATLVGYEADKDLAVLRIEAERDDLVPIPIGSSNDLLVGQSVYAIGNPFGLDQTLTTGIISALGREIQSVSQRPIQDVIQTDAAINPGNSGGPLLDSAGRLIGVNTAIYSPSGAYAGVGFAVPSDTVNRIVPQLIRHGRVIRPGFGITHFADAIARRNGLAGVLIRSVQPDSAAEHAGMRPSRRHRGGWERGDLIVEVDGEKVVDSNDLFRSLDGHRVGDRVEVTVDRDGSELVLTVTLQALED